MTIDIKKGLVSSGDKVNMGDSADTDWGVQSTLLYFGQAATAVYRGGESPTNWNLVRPLTASLSSSTRTGLAAPPWLSSRQQSSPASTPAQWNTNTSPTCSRQQYSTTSRGTEQS